VRLGVSSDVQHFECLLSTSQCIMPVACWPQTFNTIVNIIEWLPECRKTVNIFVNTSIRYSHTPILLSIPPSIFNIIERVRSAMDRCENRGVKQKFQYNIFWYFLKVVCMPKNKLRTRRKSVKPSISSGNENEK